MIGRMAGEGQEIWLESEYIQDSATRQGENVSPKSIQSLHLAGRVELTQKAYLRRHAAPVTYGVRQYAAGHPMLTLHHI
jgi:hypothetical protein